MIFRLRYARMSVALAVLFVGLRGRAIGGPVGFVKTVLATKPIAFYRLDTPMGNAVAGPTTYAAKGGATIVPGPPVGPAAPRAIMFDGTDASLLTSVAGGIDTAGSLMAWVDLGELPSKVGHIDYVAGESQTANDFDVQFEGDDCVHFYTAAGDNVKYKPQASSLVGTWHMIVVTAALTKPGAKAIYWDGKLVASDTNGGNPKKGAALSVGESTVFTGRFFNGAIADVALWNHVLNASQVAAIYKSTMVTGTE